MRYRILCAGLLASVAAGAGTAVAADYAVRPAAAPPPAPVAVAPVFINDWSGFYVGIHGGGGWGHESFENSVSECPDAVGCAFVPFVTPGDVSPKGGIFGFQFGHNWQTGPVVGGLELDFSGADLTGSSAFSIATQQVFAPATALAPPKVNNFTDTFTTDKKIDALASVRGRLGYLIFPNLLLYGTAGVGWGHERINIAAIDVKNGFLNAEDNATSDLNMFGWVAGAGLEWKWTNNWLLRGEWLHYDFLRVTNSTNNPDLFRFGADGVNFETGNVRTTVDVARAAISYKFSP